MRSYIDSEDGEESVIPPSTDRGRPTKRLPVFSKQRDRKGVSELWNQTLGCGLYKFTWHSNPIK
jgi:hypothetical protein